MTIDSETSDEQSWAEIFGAGIAALHGGNFKNATKYLEAAVDIAGRLGLIEPLTDSLLALGDAQRLSGQYQMAEETFRNAIDFSFKHPEGKRIRYAFSLGALGRLYIELERIDQARDLLEMAVSMLRHHRASAEPEFLTVFLALITCYLDQQDFEKADKLSRYTYDLSKVLVGPADAATVMAMTMCAACAEALGKQRRADILHCQIRSIIQEQKKGASDELGIAAAMMRQLERQRVVDTRPIVLSFDGEEEVVLDCDITTFGGSSTKKTRKEGRAVEPKPRLRIVKD